MRDMGIPDRRRLLPRRVQRRRPPIRADSPPRNQRRRRPHRLLHGPPLSRGRQEPLHGPLHDVARRTSRLVRARWREMARKARKFAFTALTVLILLWAR